jgi:hypothetical protein
MGYTKDMIDIRGGIEHEHCEGCDCILITEFESGNLCQSCEVVKH